jgi:hypothetical protein
MDLTVKFSGARILRFDQFFRSLLWFLLIPLFYGSVILLVNLNCRTIVSWSNVHASIISPISAKLRIQRLSYKNLVTSSPDYAEKRE